MMDWLPFKNPFTLCECCRMVFVLNGTTCPSCVRSGAIPRFPLLCPICHFALYYEPAKMCPGCFRMMEQAFVKEDSVQAPPQDEV